MARKIVLFNQKGGSGKTTSSKTIAGELSKTHNKKVLLVDCDPTINATKGLLYEHEPTINFYDMILNYIREDEEGDVSESICKTEFENLYLIPGVREKMIAADSEMLHADFSTNFIFSTLLSNVEDFFDYILFDVSCGAGALLTTNAMVFSDYVLVPFIPTLDAVEGYNYTIERLKVIRRDNRKIKYLGSFITDYDPSAKNNRDIYAESMEKIPGFIPIVVNHSKCIENSRGKGKPLCYAFPNAPVTKTFRNLTNYIIDKMDSLEKEG